MSQPSSSPVIRVATIACIGAALLGAACGGSSTDPGATLSACELAMSSGQVGLALTQHVVKLGAVGDTVRMSVNVAAACAPVTWSVTKNTAVASVSAAGTVRALASGTTFVIATSTDPLVKDSAQVTVTGVPTVKMP